MRECFSPRVLFKFFSSDQQIFCNPIQYLFLESHILSMVMKITKRSNKTFSLYSTYYESSIPFFPREKGYFCTYLTRGVYFFTLKRQQILFLPLHIVCLRAVAVVFLDDGGLVKQTYQSLDPSIYEPVNLRTCQSILGGRGNAFKL